MIKASLKHWDNTGSGSDLATFEKNDQPAIQLYMSGTPRAGGEQDLATEVTESTEGSVQGFSSSVSSVCSVA